ncbi:hypothetical protein HPB47_024000 [Ixodes persulcatus]|uniref:Uncharacterized protein n=1 Tax=Ixodes persulcatus TaxID=34615 RepID=A0AC60Q5V5_IXOPE|nr:hypothetical protein HPB47_024000 [Ixodes persulcatus]
MRLWKGSKRALDEFGVREEVPPVLGKRAAESGVSLSRDDGEKGGEEREDRDSVMRSPAAISEVSSSGAEAWAASGWERRDDSDTHVHSCFSPAFL